MSVEGTTKSWETLAAVDPLWAVLVAPGTKNGRWDVDAFAATGQREVDAAMARVADLVPGLNRSAALDFGCGVGRLTGALTRHFARVTGVDAAPSMIAHAVDLGLAPQADFVVNQEPHLRRFADDSVDLSYSSLVLQHLQRPAALAYLRELLRITRPGGCVVVQLTTVPTRSFKGLVFRYAPRRLIGWAQRALLRYPAPMLMTAFPPDVVRSTVDEIGGRILAAEADETYGGHWHYTRYYLAPPVGGARGLHATRPQ